MLSRERILELFAELDEELAAAGTRGDVFIVGGATMAVTYDARPSTQDVDGIWHPSKEVRDAAHRVAARHDDVDDDWLNDGVKGLLPGPDHGVTPVVYEGDCLSVSAGSPEYLLATKLLASRVTATRRTSSCSTDCAASRPWTRVWIFSSATTRAVRSRPRSGSTSRSSSPDRPDDRSGSAAPGSRIHNG